MLRRFIKENWKIAIWLLVAGSVMTYFINGGRDWSMQLFIKIGSFTSLMWVLLWLGNAFVSQWLDTKILWYKQPVRRFFVGLAGMIVYTLSAVYFLVFFFRYVVGLNVGNNLGGMLYSTIIITAVITMFMTSRAFLFNWRQAAVDAEKLQRESVKAQYDSLKNQVNPHFLFNSLNALTNLVYQDQDKAVKFIKQLSEVYRYVLDTRDKELVPFESELQFVQSYLFLQQIRFGDKLKVQINFSSRDFNVAPLAVQMLIENAIKHNEISEENPLSISLYDSATHIVVENSLHRKKVLPADSAGLGLENIKRRYDFLASDEVKVEESAKSFKVSLPLIKN